MTGRSFRQWCGLAETLDRIGDRWTLLIVRELLLGPRRYTDLRRNLPGIATNLLAERLRDLEQEGLVTRRDLPPLHRPPCTSSRRPAARSRSRSSR